MKAPTASLAKTKMTLSEAVKILENAGVDSPLYDARELFGLFCQRPVMLNTSCDAPELLEMIERRKNREPLQYIIGNVDFYRENYTVTPDCLIPRADTEILVDFAVKNLPRGARFIDLCTGSGCVAVSTLKNSCETTAVAVDISPAALEIARRNAGKNGVAERLDLMLADACERAVTDRAFALLSNPPYVADEVYESLEGEIFCEPKIAFVGGRDGGDFYRKITPIYRDIIDKEGFIAYEIGYDQAELLRTIAEENRMTCEIIKDLSGNNRVAVLRIRSSV